MNSQQPDRVASLCRAQWNGARFTDLVTRRLRLHPYQTDQWPTGFPADWAALPAGLEVSPSSLTMYINGLGIAATPFTSRDGRFDAAASSRRHRS